MPKTVENTLALWTAEAAAKATGGRTNSAWTVSGVSIDSRSVAKGDLFVALRGPNFDGHKFVVTALEKGASAALVDHVPEGVAANAPLLIVENTEKALSTLGGAARARTNAKIVGVTGSVGKTGVKEVLRLVLGRMGACAATEGNLNNHLGLPLSLARMSAETDFGVFEMGMNHPGELAPLSKISRPHVAIITTVEAVHAGNFKSEEAIAEAKAEIFDGMDAKGVAVLNKDNRHFERLCKAAQKAGIGRIVSFGKDADVQALTSKTDADGSDVTASVLGKEISYRVSLPGRHWVSNSLAILATVAALGLDLEQAAATLAEASPVKGRGERHTIELFSGDTITLIDESYNASPASMRAAIGTLANIEPAAGGRRIAVLGDMLELGSEYPEYHAALVNPLEEAGIDLVFTVGRGMSHLRDALSPAMRGGYAATSALLVAQLAPRIKSGDVVMVKGSAGSHMSVVVEALKSKQPAPFMAMRRG